LEKKKILITSVSEPKSGVSAKGPWTVWNFKGDDGGSELGYQTMSKVIGPKLIVDLECEIEFETTQRVSGENTYTDRKVSQMYINGEAVVQKGEFKGKGEFKRQDDSPEKRLSIERQSFMQNVCPLADCPEVPTDLKEAMWAYGRELFKDYLKPAVVKATATAVKDTAKPIDATSDAPQEAEKPFFDGVGEILWDTKTKEGFRKSFENFKSTKGITQDKWDAFKKAFPSVLKTPIDEMTQKERVALVSALEKNF
jgi:hypothetical protein